MTKLTSMGKKPWHASFKLPFQSISQKSQAGGGHTQACILQMNT